MAYSAVKDFTRALAEMDRSRSTTERFRDFCEMAYCALAKRACPFPDQAEKLEAQFGEVEARYRPHDRRRMGDMLGMTMLAVSAGGIDFMGAVAAEIGALDAGLGQFFTPYEVSRMMTEISMTDAAEIIDQKGFITVQEPAAGAGGMLLALADCLEAKGYSPERHLWIEAIELSRATYHMAYIQVSCRGLAGRVIHGNSLSLETFSAAYTAAAPHFIAANGHPFAEQMKAAEAIRQTEQKRHDVLAMLQG